MSRPRTDPVVEAARMPEADAMNALVLPQPPVADISRDELRTVAALLRDALDSLEAGEHYAHHARRPVAAALKKLTAALAAKG